MTFAMVMVGLFALLNIYYCTCGEAKVRKQERIRILNTTLVLHDYPKDGVPKNQKHRVTNSALMIGNSRWSCDICLDAYRDKRISREHCLLVLEKGNWILYPCYSSSLKGYTECYHNHSMNPVPYTGTPIRHGDSIYIFNHRISFRIGDDTDPLY